jgi:hypothetical protein
VRVAVKFQIGGDVPMDIALKAVWIVPLTASTIKLTSGRRSRRLHQYPACGGQKLREMKPFFEAAFEAISLIGSSTGSARIDQILENFDSVGDRDR